MAIRGLKPTITKVYVLKDDPCRGKNGEPLDDATIFHIKTLDGYERAFVQDQNLSIGQIKNDKGELEAQLERKIGIFQPAYAALRMGLQGWDNFVDSDGIQIEFQTEVITVGARSSKVPTWECLARIPSDAAFELMNEIMGYNTLSKDEASKSGAVSSPVKSTQNGNAQPAMPIAETNGAAEQDLRLNMDLPTALDGRPIRKVDRDPLDLGQGVRRTPLAGGVYGPKPPTSLSSGKAD